MNPYSVVVLPGAEQAILEQAEFIAADKPEAAARWLERLWDAIEELSRFPNRNAIAPAESDAIGTPVRKLVFGAYLVFYRVREDEALVEVMRFRHGARRAEAEES
ncbi:MAG: type II toxin-antitoxin system RelE/ParE family toxin [Phycisphaerales bacterium]|nr:type II toxin-antitoxin system RelE/ParE family toxin [Phycisphaerales bacterium]